MKITWMVRFSTLCLLIITVAACHEYLPPVSHFGTGRHFCYYRDERNGHFFKGVADTEKESQLMAKNACQDEPPKDLNHQYCEFVDCVFK